MAFPTTTHATSIAAVTDFLNRLQTAGLVLDSNVNDVSRVFSFLANLLARIRTYSTSINPASVAANTTAEQTFTVTGVLAGDIIYVNKPTATAGLGIVNCRASAADTIGITFSNNTGAPIDAGAETYLVFAYQP